MRGIAALAPAGTSDAPPGASFGASSNPRAPYPRAPYLTDVPAGAYDATMTDVPSESGGAARHNVFPARPFSRGMLLSTTFVSLVPAGLVVIALVQPEAGVAMLGLALLLTPLFHWAVRQSPIAYEIAHRRLVVHGRLAARHTFVLDGTVRYPAPPPRMRLFGSSGFFGHTGWFLDAEGTMVRAFVTRAEDLVVVGTDRGPIVVSPARPEAFAEAVRGGTVR